MKRATIVPVAAIAALLLAGAPAALASPSLGGGNWIDCNTLGNFRAAGPNATGTVHISLEVSGTMIGTYEGTERDVVHADGHATFHGSGAYAGTVAGRTGTGTFRYRGTFPASGTIPLSGPGAVTWTLIGTGGDLAGVNVQGTQSMAFLGTTPECDWGLYGGDYLIRSLTGI